MKPRRPRKPRNNSLVSLVSLVSSSCYEKYHGHCVKYPFHSPLTNPFLFHRKIMSHPSQAGVHLYTACNDSFRPVGLADGDASGAWSLRAGSSHAQRSFHRRSVSAPCAFRGGNENRQTILRVGYHCDGF